MYLSFVRRPERAKIGVRADCVVGARARVEGYVKHFCETIGAISTGPRFAVALALSVGMWAMQALMDL